MSPPQHFFVSFAASLLGATLLSIGTIVGRDWLAEHGVSSSLLALIVFIAGHVLIRWWFQAWVPTVCPRCQNKRAYAIPGRADRFRCEVCGADS